MNGWRATAERQYSVVTRDQLRAELTDRQIHTLISSRQLERARTAVYRVAGSYPSARRRAMAAVLWCGAGALLSHATAAELFRLPVARDATMHVTAPRAVRRSATDLRVHRSERLDPFVVDGLACTSPARTIFVPNLRSIASACTGSISRGRLERSPLSATASSGTATGSPGNATAAASRRWKRSAGESCT